MTTTIIIISLVVLVVIVALLGSRVSELRAETRTLRTRVEWLETDLVDAKKQGKADRSEWRTELEALAGVVAANAKRMDAAEAECKAIDRLRGEFADAKIDISNLELDVAHIRSEATNLVSSALYRASLAVKPQPE